MLVKYANFVKIQLIVPDKRVRPKASSLVVILIESLSLKLYRSESSTPFRLENLRKHPYPFDPFSETCDFSQIQWIKSQKWLTLTGSHAYHCVVQSFSY